MLFSIEELDRQNKKPPSRRFFKKFGWSRLACFYVNLPLFHRHWAGNAKGKIKVETAAVHGVKSGVVKKLAEMLQ